MAEQEREKMDQGLPASAPRQRRRRVGIRLLLIALAASEAIALVGLVLVAVVSLLYTWNPQSQTIDVALGLAALVLAVILGYAFYRTVKAAYRRRFQFSLRGLLLATAAVALLLGTLGQQVLRYHRLHQVLDAGALFRYGSTYQSRYERQSECGWLESRLGYDPFRQITAVDVSSDEALGNMAAHVECFSHVDGLVLSSPRITDEGLARADALVRLPRLRDVNLINCNAMTDAGLESLSRWSQVEALMINSSRGITDDGLAHLACMTQLKHLWFVAEGGGTLSVSDAGLAHLGQVPRLESVMVSGVGISDAGLKHLEGIKQLKQILLKRTSVSEAGAKHLQQMLPNCQVKWMQ